MATITISIPDAAVTRVTDAFTKQFAYQDTIPDPNNPGATIPNPETKAQFVQRMIRNYIKEVVASYEARVAGDTAAQQARVAIDT